MRRGKRTLSYRAILLMVATLVLLLDIVLAAVIYRHYISPSYSKNLQARMREAFSQVAADPTGSQTALLRENFHVLVLRENGQLVTANVEPRQEDLENLRRTVDRAVVQPVFQTTGSDTEGELSLLGSSGGYYIEVSTQLDPIFSVAMTFTRYSIATGVIVWFATLLLVVAIERQLFQPIGEAVQVAKRIARQDFSQKCGTGGIARQSRALAESLNEMSDQLQSALSQLRQANAQLQDDIRAIERSESAMKHLIGNLSHDLKTPLALISGYAEGLSAGMAKTPDQQQEYCGIILDETERMRQIITRMLQLSQLESGQVQLELERFDIARLLENTLNQFSMEMEKAGVALEREVPPQLWTVTDYIACDQVLTNLIQNAVFHTTPPCKMRVRAFYRAAPAPEQEPQVQAAEALAPEAKKSYPARLVGAAWTYLRSRGQQEAADAPADAAGPDAAAAPATPRVIRIEVYNSSEPIGPEQMAHLFDRFYRGEQSRRRAGGQLGLGLAIVRGNMELLEQPYGVYNAPGGVVFWIEFPAAPE